MNHKNNISIIISIVTYAVLIVVSLSLPFISFDGYSILSNTTSHLGAQGSPNAWVVNLTFILLGLNTLRVMIHTQIKYHQFFGSIFGISLILTGIFQHASFVTNYETILWKDQLHSVFATSTGIAFIWIAFGQGFMSEGKQRYAGIFFGVFATLLSILMGWVPNYMGLFQRIMFYGAFYYMFFYLKPNNQKQSQPA